MKQTKVFEAEDGRTFATARECKAHEQSRSIASLCGLDESDIRAAFNRDDIVLADAIERAGNIIAKKRRASGEFKRGSLKQARENFKAGLEKKV